jgi:enoyl-CoA hydratase/carnithine racemase
MDQPMKQRGGTVSTSESEAVRLEIEGGIAVLILNRPSVRNAIDLQAAHRLSALVDQIEADAAVRVGVITGAGRIAFCAGADLRARARGEPRATLGEHGFAGFARRKRQKPFIAAVNGFAVGGGLEIAGACELIVAAPHASFSLPEPLRGLIAGGECLPAITSRLSRALAWEVALTGRPLAAAEALGAGMINRVADDPVAEAKALASQIIAGAPLAVAATVELMRMLETSVPGSYAGEAEAIQARLMQSQDSREGAKAFLEKR